MITHEEASAALKAMLVEYGLRWVLGRLMEAVGNDHIVDMIRRDRDSWRAIAQGRTRRAPAPHRVRLAHTSTWKGRVSQETIDRVKAGLAVGARTHEYLVRYSERSARQITYALRALQDSGLVKRIAIKDGSPLFQLAEDS